eukprot:gnl/Trimastix_PCT/905.p1 GENE.gnl/Trimastix_PCT/905~~gnl/Trimastix_PCT/905.p1  ORF type:complete len:394 (+),score=66.99 gnl/Trimastix_PCT/905:38-1183(+)
MSQVMVRSLLFLFPLLFLACHAAHHKSKILMIYTGGTIGMKKTEHGFSPVSGYLEHLMETMPQFQSPILPEYRILEFNPLLDSSQMHPSNWVKIASTIKQYYNEFDGFIVLHGTDTMAFTSSALSFLLENLNKTVVVTGSQVPLCEPYSDAMSNLLASLLTASKCTLLKEVVVVFQHKIFRGNRVQKVSAWAFDGFNSGSYPELGSYGGFPVMETAYWRPPPTGAFTPHLSVEPHVVMLHLHPGITADVIRKMLSPPTLGAVMLAYGTGTGPTTDPNIIAALREAIERGVHIVDVTQCHQGYVDLTTYAAALAYREIGILSGGDMTSEAAFTKLAFLLGDTELSHPQVRYHMEQNLRGEMTRPLDVWRGMRATGQLILQNT